MANSFKKFICIIIYVCLFFLIESQVLADKIKIRPPFVVKRYELQPILMSYGLSLEEAHELEDMIDNASKMTGVDKYHLTAMICAESSFRHYNERGQVLRSRAGALGYMQLMPSTARMLNVDPAIPEQNIYGGSIYYREQLGKFKDERMALYAYNAGPTKVSRGIVPKESRDYAEKIIRLKNTWKKE